MCVYVYVCVFIPNLISKRDLKPPAVSHKKRKNNAGKKYSPQSHFIWKTYNRGVSLKVQRGTFLMIYGTSGGGKTSLLNCLGTIDKPTKGFLNIAGLSENISHQIFFSGECFLIVLEGVISFQGEKKLRDNPIQFENKMDNRSFL